MSIMVKVVRIGYSGACAALNRLQSLLLLAIRLYWGWQFRRMAGASSRTSIA